MQYKNRADAGKRLANGLLRFEVDQPLVLGLARGGAPIAAVIAETLHADLDFLITVKIGHPHNPECAIGAMAEDEQVVWHDGLTDIPRHWIREEVRRRGAELRRRRHLYRGDRPCPKLADRTVILADDGVATGSTMVAAIRAVERCQPRRIVVASPVAHAGAAALLRAEVHDVELLQECRLLYAISEYYEAFEPVTDDEIVAMMRPCAVA